MSTLRDDVTVVRYPDAPPAVVGDRRLSRPDWPVSWSAVWVGALAALAAALCLGLIGIAVGAHQVGPQARTPSTQELGFGALVFSVAGAFFSFVIGGWVTGRIAGFRHAEPSMLHGAVAWLVALPILLLLVAIGAGSLFGGWVSGLAGSPAWITPPGVPGTTAPSAVPPLDPQAAAAVRNSALGALTALLLGLVGGVIGGWMASGEPMSLTYYRQREAAAGEPAMPASPTAPTVVVRRIT